MDESELLSLLGIVILLKLALVTCVAVLWRRVSRSTASPNPPPLPGAGELARRMQELEADQVALSSNLEKVATTAKRLTSRAGMRDLREKRGASRSDPPPIGTSKAELLRYYGMSGKVGPEFARAQQELERRTPQSEFDLN